MTELHRGQRLGHYEIIDQVGAGGMGVVYKARDTNLDRIVAVKALRAPLTMSEEARDRFLREARTAAAVNHPNIATTYAIEEYGDRYYLALEFVEGTTVAEIARRERPTPPEQAVNLVTQAAEGLAAAHARGIVHRDIKPSNLLVTPDGTVKVTDFGLAKRMTGDTLTVTGSVVGTLAYMSPEQAAGEPVDARSDVWSLGVVLFELLVGEMPFHGGSDRAVLHDILMTDPPLHKLPPGLPDRVARVLRTALSRDPASRYESGTQMVQALHGAQRHFGGTSVKAAEPRAWDRRRTAGALAAVAAIVAIAGIYWQRQSRVRWARTVAVPAIVALLDEQRFADATTLVLQAEQYLGDDVQLQQLKRTAGNRTTVFSVPDGASVYVRQYLSDSTDWLYIGDTPLHDVFVPGGNVRWELRLAGHRPAHAVPSILTDTLRFRLTPDSIDHDMLWVPAGSYRRGVGAPGGGGAPVELDAYWLDRLEVSNRDFQDFVAAGGYADSAIWADLPFEDTPAGTWRNAVSTFRDATGRPGPAGWELGRFADGTAEEPVRGVSWFEAAAYCAFSDKALPTYHHWFRAAAPGLYSDILLRSNFGDGPTPGGAHDGIAAFGHLDMAGNVKEWTWNAVGDERYALGGAWNEPAYQFRNDDARPPLDRAPTHGFRCARYESAIDPALLAPLPPQPRSPLPPPVSDEIFDVFRRMYAFDDTPLNATVVQRHESHPDWDMELVSFDAAYGDERVLARIYFPKAGTAQPPYQTVVYFPGSDGLRLQSSDGMMTQTFFDFVPRSGRVLVHPIYKGTYERLTGVAEPVTGAASERFNAWRDQVVQWVRDQRRTVDYLETREDIDTTRLAFMGLSLGGRYAPIFMALEDRFDAGLVIAGGFSYATGIPDEILPIHYAPRSAMPALMINGNQDFTRPLETAIQPMFDAFGAPEADKRLVLVPHGHLPPKNDLVREALDWLDRYLGEVAGAP